MARLASTSLSPEKVLTAPPQQVPNPAPPLSVSPSPPPDWDAWAPDLPVDLQGGDLDLDSRRLIVRQGKGSRDRVVYLSDTACQALISYLDGRRPAP